MVVQRLTGHADYPCGLDDGESCLTGHTFLLYGNCGLTFNPRVIIRGLLDFQKRSSWVAYRLNLRRSPKAGAIFLRLFIRVPDGIAKVVFDPFSIPIRRVKVPGRLTIAFMVIYHYMGRAASPAPCGLRQK